MLKKIFSLMLCVLLLFCAVSCVDTQTPSDDTTASLGEDTTKALGGDTTTTTTTTTTTPSAPADPQPVWLNIATYNIVHCADQTLPDQGPNPMNIVNVIKDQKLDICGLNEVDRNMLRSGGYDQPKYIADKLTELTGEQYYWAFSTSTKDLAQPFFPNYSLTDGHGLYGNAIISKYPIVSAREVSISMRPEQYQDGYERRSLLIAEIEINGEILTVISSHFCLKADGREKAVDLIAEELAKITTPVVVMGDFNDGYDSSCVTRLSTMLKPTSPGATPYTFPSNAPRSKIDYIFTSNSLQTRNLRVGTDIKWSDHMPVMVELLWE